MKKPSALSRIASRVSDPRNVSNAVEAQKTRHRGQAPYEAPATATEGVVSAIWAKLLALDKVGRGDNFFQSGGHSLLATQMLARVRDACDVELPLKALFDAPVLAQFAQKVEAVRSSGPVVERLTRQVRGDTAPLSFAQQRLWFLDELAPGNAFYNVPARFRLYGKLNREALQGAIDAVVARQESLRTTFAQSDAGPVQVIAPELKLPVREIDLNHLQADLREVEASRLADEEAAAPFDLAAGPLFRVLVIRLAEDEHEMVLNTHHIVYDRWSQGILMEEITTRYRALCEGTADAMPPLPVQYADYSIWQRRYLESGVLARQVSYWKERLAGAPAVIEFPADRPRAATGQHRGAMEEFALPGALVSRMRQLCQEEGATLFMGMLAAFQMLLSRYSGLEDIVVGSPIANRSLTEIEPLIGFFVSTLALRTDLSGNPPFRELLHRTRATCLGAYSNEAVPFERLVEELQPERSLSHNPIFQVMFALQPAPVQSIELPRLRMERRPIHAKTAVFDQAWFAFENPEGILLRVEYDTALFDRSTIQRTVKLYTHLLDSALATPDSGIAQLELLTADERNKVVVEFNQTAADFEPGLRIHDFVERQAETAPAAIAIVCGLQRWTYAELNARANRIAHALRPRGVGPDVLVGVYMERTPEMLAAVLGILKAGGAYVPLDPNYPSERLALIIADAKAPVVLTQRSLAASLPACAEVEVICTDASAGDIAGALAINPGVPVSPGHLAYVLFTSGSTGRPKGVAIEHRSAATLVQWASQVFTAPELSGVLFSTSICFDLSIFEIFVTWSSGGKVIIAENALYLPTLPAKNEVTLINTVPSAIAELVRMNGIPDSVKVVNLAGEALSQTLVEQIHAHTPVEKVYNLYGPTEDTTYSTFTLVHRGARVTIGRPVANTQAYVADSRLNPVPVGVSGELYLAGAGLARGYYGREDLTRERFVDNPFSPGERMYKTGDLCRWLADGNIEYLGRIDYQVKIRGFRIELGEIESVLDSHPGVQQSLVLAREDIPGRKQLVAYVVPAANQSVAEDDLRAQIKRRLPDFMMPAAFVTLSAFPLNSNGKIDRKALPAPEQEMTRPAGTRAPRTETEEILAGTWAEILRLPAVGADQDFFELGGHSLLATQVVSRVRQTLGVALPLQAIFEDTTVESLARRVEALMRSGSAEDAPPLEPVERTGPMPLSFSQQRVWFFDQLAPNTSTFSLPWTMRATGHLDLEALQAAFDAVATRHETLRTVFHSRNGEPVQVILPKAPIPLHVVDENEAEWRKVAQAEIDRPFDLSRDRLMRVTVLRLGADDHVLIIVMHHIISDRWSTGVLGRELTAFYNARIRGVDAALAPLRIQYADYAAWQRDCLRGEVLRSQLAYWKEELRGAPQVIAMPTDRPRRGIAGSAGGTASLALPDPLARALESLARREHATMFMVLLAGFEILLGRYSGQDDLVVGTPVANRNRTETESLIGLFVNTLPLRGRLEGDPSFSEFLARVRATALRAYAHQDLPFDMLVEELHPERSLAHDPVVQVFFALQNAPVEEGPELEGVTLARQFMPTSTAKGDLFLSVGTHAGGLLARLEYNSDLFDHATMDRMLGHFAMLLGGAAEHPETSLSRLPLLSVEERRRLVNDFNDTAREYPRGECLHQLLARQAAISPHKIAAISGTRRLTFGELDARANQLAHGLLQRGAMPDSLIGIRVARGVDMLVALLGVLKSGAAYVPLDPAFPEERIAYILKDSAARFVLTDEWFTESGWEPFARLPVHEPVTRVAPGHLAYVLHTSGSTGRPKGVQITHRNLVNFLTSMRREPGFSEDDTLLAVTTLSFDIAGLELYLPLLAGGTVAIASREEASDGALLLRSLEKIGATVLQATPATWRMLLQAGWSGSPRLKALCGGEALPAELTEQLLPRCRELWNMYGPTETTIWSSVYRLRSVPAGVAPLGRPIANTTMYVLDRQMEVAPVGVEGELYIGGDGVARGYLNRPDLTAERFVADPFVPGGRLYRTGDVAKMLPTGDVHYLGRTDFQVKVRGFRIELGEVESVLGQHSSVRECVVAALDERLVGYVVAAPGESVHAPELRAWVKERLPEYMVPAAFVELTSLPLTPNGKVDRKALPSPELGAVAGRAGMILPRTPAEQVVAQIWAQVLKVEKLGIEDNFFELGGHSLLATQVVSRVRDAFEVDLSLRTLFESPTVAGLVAAIQHQRGERRGDRGLPMPALVPVARDQALPLSFAQQRLWFLDQLEPGNRLYNVPQATRMTGALNVSALENALNMVVKRHEVLRTTYQAHGEEPVQAILPEWTVAVPVTDLSEWPHASKEKEALRALEAEARRPFDLARGPVIRALLIRLDPEDHVFFFNIHHIAYDGWSMSVIMNELTSLYNSFVEEKPAALPELPVQYADYAVWQRNWLQGEVLTAQLAYWRNRLRDAPPLLVLPTDRPRPAVQSFRGDVLRTLFPSRLALEIHTLSRRHGTTPFMTMLAAFQSLIGYRTTQSDIVIGTDVAGRPNVETEALIGFFVNLIVLRTDLSADPSFEELLGRVRETALAAYEHQDLPFDKLVAELQPERTLSHNPLVQVLFVQNDALATPVGMHGIEFGPFRLGVTSRFDLALFVGETRQGILCNWVYNADLFDRKTIDRMADLFQMVLEKATANPEIRLHALMQELARSEDRENVAEHQGFQDASLRKLKTVRRRPGTIETV